VDYGLHAPPFPLYACRMQWSCVGHEKQKTHFERLIERDALPHALLFAGPEGVGKRMLAQDLIGALVPHGYQFDRRILMRACDDDGVARTIPVEIVREMKQWMSLRPMGTRKIVVVDDADLLSGDAANTLLKLLEEPPVYGHLILITSNAGALLPTIASRCERFDFSPLSDAEMSSMLSHSKLTTDSSQLLSIIAAGRPGVALQLITKKRLPRVEEMITGFERSLDSGVTERLVYAKELADADDLLEIVGWWVSWVQARLHDPLHQSGVRSLATVAAGLLDMREAIADPIYNRRLALDRFFLTIP
jgi:predicted AAA+ superfamily ATPase